VGQTLVKTDYPNRVCLIPHQHVPFGFSTLRTLYKYSLYHIRPSL